MKSMKVFVGLDPGVSGAISLIDTSCDKTKAASHALKNMTEHDILELLEDLQRGSTVAYIEKVASMPRDGSRAAFTFGMSYGGLRMALIAARIPSEAISPIVWQREFSLTFPKKLNLTKTQKKNRHKAKAQELFPGLKITHANADSLLIAECCRRKWK